VIRVHLLTSASWVLMEQWRELARITVFQDD